MQSNCKKNEDICFAECMLPNLPMDPLYGLLSLLYYSNHEKAGCVYMIYHVNASYSV